MDEKTKRRISTTKKGTGIGVDNSMWGKTHPEEIKQRIAIARTGTKWMYDPIALVQKAVPADQVDIHLKIGWKLGRMKLKKKTTPDFLLSY
jgi:hypothetical protein